MPLEHSFYLSPDLGGTGTFPVVHAGADSLESQADARVQRILQVFSTIASDPWTKEQILHLQTFIYQSELSSDEMVRRIERATALILGHCANQFRQDIPFLESVYPGFTDRFFRELKSYVESLVSSTRSLIERDVRIDQIRRLIDGSILDLLERSRVSFDHQKWEGAYNRRGFDHYRAQALHATLRRQARQEESARLVFCSQIMIDLDKFKDVNDRYGNEAGDQVLRTVLDILQRTVRDIDIIGMPGGDEYLVALADTDEAGALKLATRILHNFERQTLCVQDRDGLGVALDGLDGRLKVGLSIGVTTVSLPTLSAPLDSKTISTIVEEVEKRLSKDSELAMEGAKVLDKPANGNGGGAPKNAIMTYPQAAPRRDEINRLINLKNVRRSGS